MPHTLQAQLCRNRLLSGLDAHDVNLIWPQLKPVPLVRRHRLEQSNRPIDTVYFVETGLVSVVATARGGQLRATVELIGFEGMTGLAVVYGSSEPSVESIVECDGSALAIDALTLKALLGRSATMAGRFTLYAHALQAQAMFGVLASTEGSIEQRLSLRLLMAQDRLQSDALGLTHETLAEMLGVRRPAITIALRRLETLGFISAKRGNVVILDREAIIQHANGLYGLAEAEYERLLK